jgi:hypothetical protein
MAGHHPTAVAAAARQLLTRLRAAAGRGEDYRLSRWFFVRAVAVVYGLAFLSLWVQFEGLIGRNGILPAAEYLEAVAKQAGAERFWFLPTLCWLSASDGFLHCLCGGGVVLAVLAGCGVAARLALALAWVFYLSLTVVGREFLSFQWDALLLEVGLLTVFYAPGNWRPGLAPEKAPSVVVLWLLRWLLFRFMFMSGAVKLLSHDATWWNLGALSVHYETQPLPTRIGWYAHQLPAWFQELSVLVMFVIELALPFLIFCGRRARWMAAAAFTGLMLLIALTGNYCFFNLLTVVLCLPLLDDRALLRLLPGRLAEWVKARLAPAAQVDAARVESPSSRDGPLPPGRSAIWTGRFRVAGLAALATIVLSVSGAIVVAQLFRLRAIPPPLSTLVRLVSPFRAINSYGLFAVMTTRRPEIIVEGSNDGQTWRAYEFKWKPGDLRRPPGFVAPHQPRLDWQMWFAALGDVQGNPWFVNFLARLLQGTPEVTALLASNPFPAAPPRFVRAQLYDYHFTDFATRRQTGEWWRREYKGVYCPELSFRRQPPESP